MKKNGTNHFLGYSVRYAGYCFYSALLCSLLNCIFITAKYLMKFIAGRSFRYDIQECIPHYYQIQGINSAGLISVTIQACDLDDLCTILQDPKYDFKIKKVFRSNSPVLSANSNGTDLNTTEVKLPKGFIQKCRPPEVKKTKSKKIKKIRDNVQLSYADTSSPQHTKHTVGEPNHRGFGFLKLSVGDFDFVASGVVVMSAYSTLDADDEGSMFVDIPVSAYLDGEAISELNTASVPSTPIPLLISNKFVPCCSGPVPLILEFRHNLNLISDLNRFVNQNNVILPGLTDFVKLNFSERDQSWVGSIHLVGNSTIGGGQESWDLNIGFGCNNNGNWDFVLSIILRRPSQRFVSRITSSFPTSVVCRNGNFYKLLFSFTNGVSTLATATTVNDEVRFFRNLQLSFRINPQNIPSLSQLAEDNTAAYNATLGSS